ncbi:hypothetical protein [Bacteroides sp. 519]|uniref:hypothetical protein n=1 Tax=Bacteroides sp. 519 TaxID=2302937 RepID=UPI0013D6272F|nr:hypothetical protein [Bacteroides sp. 519]NDV59817.1 hypothetical protein [Bacteroides sp. 519]
MRTIEIEEFEPGYKLTYPEVKQMRLQTEFHLLKETFNLTFHSFKIRLGKIDANILVSQYYYKEIATECYLSLCKSDTICLITLLNEKYQKCFYREQHEHYLFQKLPQKGWKLSNGNIISEPEFSYYEFYEFRFKIISPEFEYC